VLLPELDHLSLLVKKTRVSNDIQSIGSVNPGPVVVVLVKMGIGSITPNLISLLTGVQSDNSSFSRSRITTSDTSQNAEKVASAGNMLAAASGRLVSAGTLFEKSKEVLGDLLKIVEKGISLADRASKSSTSNSQRRALDKMFQGLERDFAALAKDADKSGIDLLSKYGLERVLEITGLSKENSKDIAQLVNRFFVAGNNSSLADLELKGRRGAPPTLSQSAQSEQGYVGRKVSYGGRGVDPGPVFVTAQNVVYSDENQSLGLIQGAQKTILSQDNIGNTTAFGYTGYDLTVMDVSENSGYVLGKSTADYFSYNPDGLEQLFLFDKGLNALSQLTFFKGDEEIYIESASISSEGEKFSFVTNANFMGGNTDLSAEIYFGDIGAGTLAMVSNLDSGGVIKKQAISEDGSTLGFTANGTAGGSPIDGYYIYDMTGGDGGTLISDGSSTANTFLGFNFSGGVKEGITYSESESMIYGDNAGETRSIVDAKLSASKIAAVSEDGHLAYEYSGDVKYYQIDGSSPAESVTSGTITGLSVASGPDNTVRIGASGTISSFGATPAAFLFETNTGNVSDQNRTFKEVDSVFDYSLTNQISALRAKEDLQSISKQIKKNLKVVEDGAKTIDSNLKLSILFSETFLSISSDPKAVKSADTVASSVQKAIRSYGSSIKSEDFEHLDNLISIKEAI
jgi:hypothetical protein